MERAFHQRFHRMAGCRNTGSAAPRPPSTRRNISTISTSQGATLLGDFREIAAVAGLCADQCGLAHRHHAGRRLLYAARLGSHGRDHRRSRPAAPSRGRALARARHRPRARRLRARAVACLPVSWRLVRGRPVGDRAEFRLPHRRHRGLSELHPLCRLDHGLRSLDHRRHRSGMAAYQSADRGRGDRDDRADHGRLCAVAAARRRLRRAASGLDHVRAARLRRAVRLYRPHRRRAGRGGARRASCAFLRGATARARSISIPIPDRA